MKRKRETLSGDGDQIVVRLPPGTVEKLDEIGERMRKENPGPAWRRSDVVRLLLLQGIEGFERKPVRK